jgi:Nucleotide-sugar transporter
MTEKDKPWHTMSLRTSILVAICLQNAGYTLLRKYSTANENVSSKEILLVSEVIKLVVSAWITVVDTEQSDAVGKGISKLTWLVKHSGKMFVLAAIYGAMNILSFVALQYIGAGEFTICAQVVLYFIIITSLLLQLYLIVL